MLSPGQGKADSSIITIFPLSYNDPELEAGQVPFPRGLCNSTGLYVTEALFRMGVRNLLNFHCISVKLRVT